MSTFIDKDKLREVGQWLLDKANALETLEVPDPEPEEKRPAISYGATLDEARQSFADLHQSFADARLNVERVDCDLVRPGLWMCSSERMENGVIDNLPELPVQPENPETPDLPSEEASKANVVRLPEQAENRFKYIVNSSSDSDVYAGFSEYRQVFVFYNTERETCVTSRRFPDGQFDAQSVNIHRFIGGGRELEYDNHNNAVVGAAPDGTIFVCANHHVDPLSMAYTTRPHDLTSFKAFDRNDMPQHYRGKSDTDRITYPSFFKHDGYLCLSYREQEAGVRVGTSKVSQMRWMGKKYRHDLEIPGWENMFSLNTGNNLRLYVSNIATSADGSLIALAATWRNDNVNDKGTEHQYDYFVMWSKNGRDFFQSTPNGIVKVPLPVVWTAPGKSTVPYNIWSTKPGGDPTPNGAGSIAFTASNRVHCLMDIRGGQLVHHWEDSDGWHEARDILDTADEDPFPVRDNMCAVSHKGDSIYFHVLNSPNKPTTQLLAKGYVNGDFNISVDRSAITLGYLSVMMTKCKSAAPRSTKERYATDVYFLTIPLDDLLTFNKPFNL